MTTLDYVVLVAYFTTMGCIGIWAMRRTKVQEDYFMGGRSFGKLMQTFAAFGAGTGSADPINTARTTYTSGLSGMWSVMYWLFVTPLYWISGVWYRRMRHMTLGDWFVERYESKSLGAAYTLFGLFFYVVYTGMLFTAVGKFAAPLMDVDAVVMFGQTFQIENVLVAFVAVMVILYGALGGLTAAYWTDVIQGVCIIMLSLLLIPAGLFALAERFGDVYPGLGTFEILHKELPAEYFSVVGSSGSSEFPIYSIVAIVVINMIGIVVTPHFIATGGGTAKTELDARVGLVTGNLLKRFCTVGWALTALIALALFADHPDLVNDPDMTWGVASRELLGPGLLGLMLACLLAALMSSADAYMLVTSALVVRNIYAAYIDPDASETTYVNLGRITGAVIIVGAVLTSWLINDVLVLLMITWVLPIVFAAPFWVGHFWRRATATAAWTNVVFCVLVFALLPFILPAVNPSLRESPTFTQTNDIIERIETRTAAPSDVARRRAAIDLWDRRAKELDTGTDNASADEDATAIAGRAVNPEIVEQLGDRPKPLALGDTIEERSTSGGTAIFWSGGVVPVEADVVPMEIGRETDEKGVVTITKRYAEGAALRGSGRFVPDYLLYDVIGINLREASTPMLNTLSMLPKIVTPFLIVIAVSMITRRQSDAALDRYYAKMKTPVLPDPEEDIKELEASYADPRRFDHKKLFPNSDFEMQRPTMTDVLGLVLTFAACFGVIGLVVLLASIGA